VDPEAIRTFIARDRERVAALKREHHARRYRASRGNAGLVAGQLLWAYTRRVRRDWPTKRDRGEDLAHHVELKRRIDLARDAFSPR
jgi:hypothetical protein